VFFVIGDEVVTPSLSEGSILPGVTRASCIELLKSKGYKVSERKISVDELYEAYDRGELKEAFGTGTAAVISPIGSLDDENKKALINNGEIGPISQMLYDTLTGIQWGNLPDPFGWIKVIG
jgi:branched-chain amino acid aminotransferase